MVEPGALQFDEDEVLALRKYLLNGGFLMADDFWGSRQWENFASEMKRVFPDREFSELEMDHAVFKCVFDLAAGERMTCKCRTLDRERARTPARPGRNITMARNV
jgi:hypothetical protein